MKLAEHSPLVRLEMAKESSIHCKASDSPDAMAKIPGPWCMRG